MDHRLHRLHGETWQASDRFGAFCHTPATRRSMARLAREIGVSRQAVQHQARRWDWFRRAAVFDRLCAPSPMQLVVQAAFPDSPVFGASLLACLRNGSEVPANRQTAK